MRQIQNAKKCTAKACEFRDYNSSFGLQAVESQEKHDLNFTNPWNVRLLFSKGGLSVFERCSGFKQIILYVARGPKRTWLSLGL